MADNRLPNDWDSAAHAHWLKGNKQAAINTVLTVINSHGPKKPVSLVLQLSYYIFFIGDSKSAAHFLEMSRVHYPQHPELLLNLAVCLSRSGQYQDAVLRSRELLSLEPENVVALDTLTKCLHKSGQDKEASDAGTKVLALKDQANKSLPHNWSLPHISPRDWANSPDKHNIIAFSLWGANPRYLRGAIDNALAASKVYPGWTLRFYVDDTVPLEVCETLLALGATVLREPLGQNTLQRLTWRFKVANDPTVGRFLVRDVDSLIGIREKQAVDAWISSDRWFHVMRDWWTHTDLILAGMWGGIAGVLPPMEDMVATYTPPVMETPNIDQWFLRDRVWSYVRTSCLVHDRCFTPPNAQPWPVTLSQDNGNVGQDVFTSQREAQEQRLIDWLSKLKSLHLPPS